MRKWLCVAAFIAAVVASPHAAAEAPCSGTVSRGDVVDCALRVSLTVRAAAQTVDALEGRRVAQTPFLPSNPVLSVSAAQREFQGTRVTNWSAALDQQVEIAGQRSVRRRAAELGRVAQEHRVTATRREVAAVAWFAYFDALSAAEELRLTTRIAGVSTQIATVTRAMADRGVLAPVEADVADAARVAIDQAQLAAERRSRTAQLGLAVLLGGGDANNLTISGDLEPLRGVEEEARAALGRDGSERPEVRAFDAERRSQEAAATAWERARIPNVTVTAFAQNDGFNERVLGLGLSVPIPVPQPVGRLYNGEIAEANALASRAGTEAESARRRARLDLGAALVDFDTRRRERDFFTAERLTRAQQGVDAIAREIEVGRLSLREALVSQQALIGLLRAGVEARHALCVASVELGRAAGVPLEKGPR